MTATNTATVTISVSMAGASFSSASLTVTGTTAPVIEDTIAASATVTIPGIGTIDKDQVALIYLLSDTTDCHVHFTNSGTAIPVDLVAGIPFVMYDQAAIAAFLERDVLTMTVQNMDTTAGVANAVATDFHARLIYTE